MSKFRKSFFKYISIFGTDINCSWIHTSRSILPNLARGESQTPDYLQCLRPATMTVSDAPTLAGDPRASRPDRLQIETEVYKKWNSKSEMPYKDWSSYTWWGRDLF